MFRVSFRQSTFQCYFLQSILGDKSNSERLLTARLVAGRQRISNHPIWQDSDQMETALDHEMSIRRLRRLIFRSVVTTATTIKMTRTQLSTSYDKQKTLTYHHITFDLILNFSIKKCNQGDLGDKHQECHSAHTSVPLFGASSQHPRSRNIVNRRYSCITLC